MPRFALILGLVAALLVGRVGAFSSSHVHIRRGPLVAEHSLYRDWSVRGKTAQSTGNSLLNKHHATRYTNYQTSPPGQLSNLSTPGVYGLMLAQIGVFLADTMTRTLFVNRHLYLWHSAPGYKVWQTLTAVFCHRNQLHLINNLFLLALLGRSVQAEFGTKGLLLSFSVCGIASSLVSLSCLPARSVTMGAAGALMGLYLMTQVGNFLRARDTSMDWRQVLDEMDWRQALEALVMGAFALRQLIDEISFGGKRSIKLAAHLGGALVAAIASRWILTQTDASPRYLQRTTRGPSGRSGQRTSRSQPVSPTNNWRDYVQPNSSPNVQPQTSQKYSQPPTQSIRPTRTGQIESRASQVDRVVRPEPVAPAHEEPIYEPTKYKRQPSSSTAQNHMGTWVTQQGKDDHTSRPAPGVRTPTRESNNPGSFPQEASPGWIQRIKKPVSLGLQRVNRKNFYGSIERVQQERGVSVRSVETSWSKGLENGGIGNLSKLEHKMLRRNGQRLCNEDAFSLGQTNFGLVNEEQHRRTDPELEYNKVFLNGVEVAASVSPDGRINYGMTHTGMKVEPRKHWWQSKGREHESPA